MSKTRIHIRLIWTGFGDYWFRIVWYDDPWASIKVAISEDIDGTLIAINPWDAPGAGEVGPYKEMIKPPKDGMHAHEVPENIQLRPNGQVPQGGVEKGNSPSIKTPAGLHSDPKKIPRYGSNVPISQSYPKQLGDLARTGAKPVSLNNLLKEGLKVPQIAPHIKTAIENGSKAMGAVKPALKAGTTAGSNLQGAPGRIFKVID